MELENKLKKLRVVLQDDFVCSVIVTEKEIKLSVIDLQKELPETNEPDEEESETNPQDYDKNEKLDIKESKLNNVNTDINTNNKDINRGDGSFNNVPDYIV